ncbi:MAG: type 1 glutamine amidotransferase [Thermoleophilaceae bacterium]|nr:type 1 glutamine amidotransferase [Thermoleophilaceae bacterium]
MLVLAIVHQRDAGAGVFGDALRDAGAELIEWVPSESGPPEVGGLGAALTFGGAMHADQEDANPWLPAEKYLLAELLRRGVPLLGVCLGAQLLSEAAGGAPRRASEPEIGWVEVELTPEGRRDPLTGPLPERFEAFEWHSYEAGPPDGSVILARSAVCVQAYRLAEAPAWGIQFHAEVAGADVGGWLDGYDADEDAVRIGLDPEALRAETVPRLDEWNELGRGFAQRFLAEAARHSGVT